LSDPVYITWPRPLISVCAVKQLVNIEQRGEKKSLPVNEFMSSVYIIPATDVKVDLRIKQHRMI